MTPELKKTIEDLETLKQAVDRAAVVKALHDPSHEARYREACRNAVPVLIAALREQEEELASIREQMDVNCEKDRRISELEAEVARLTKELSECIESHQKRNAELAELEDELDRLREPLKGADRPNVENIERIAREHGDLVLVCTAETADSLCKYIRKLEARVKELEAENANLRKEWDTTEAECGDGGYGETRDERTSGTLIDDAVECLKRYGEPQHIDKLTELVSEHRGATVTRANLEASLSQHLKATNRRVTRVRAGYYGVAL